MTNTSVTEADRQSSGYQFFTGSVNADYNSSTNIAGTDDLQVSASIGKLIYPQANYENETEYPNSVNYSNATGDRYYYRAFHLGDNFSNQYIKIKLKTDFAASDVYATTGQGADTKKVRIDIKVPGPVNNTAYNDGSEPGSGWGCVSGGSGATLPGGSNPGIENWKALQTFYEKGNNSSEGGDANTHIYKVNLRNYGLMNADGVILMRIRIKDTATGNNDHIDRIDVEDWT